MTKDEALMKAITEFEILSSFPQYDFDYVDLIKELKACKEALETPECNTHPKAPHGFNRNASHSAGRYVCECEGWQLEWQELSGDDMHKIIVKYVSVDCTCDPYEYARAIEQELKTKNGFSALKEKNYG